MIREDDLVPNKEKCVRYSETLVKSGFNTLGDIFRFYNEESPLYESAKCVNDFLHYISDGPYYDENENIVQPTVDALAGYEFIKFLNYMRSTIHGIPFYGELLFPASYLKLLRWFHEESPIKFIYTTSKSGVNYVVGSHFINDSVVLNLPKRLRGIPFTWESCDTGTFAGACSTLLHLAKENAGLEDRHKVLLSDRQESPIIIE